MSRSHSRPARRTPACERGFVDSPVASRALCRQAASARSPLELERWASSFLGRLWERRDYVRAARGVDPLFVLGQPILRSCADTMGCAAKTALGAVARIDRGELGLYAGELALSLGDGAIPEWIEQVGSPTIVRAFSEASPRDGEALLLEANVVGDGEHMLAVFIADRLGGAASVLRLTRKLDPTNPLFQDEGSGTRVLGLRPVDATLACRRALEAIDRTDDVPGAWIDEGFADNRALAIARTTPFRLGVER